VRQLLIGLNAPQRAQEEMETFTILRLQSVTIKTSPVLN
jgi:hypothetical protein